jgi:hypothetical protein
MEDLYERAATEVIWAAIAVHRGLGCGYDERVYQKAILRANKLHLGLLLNFNVPTMKAGVHRVIHK